MPAVPSTAETAVGKHGAQGACDLLGKRNMYTDSGQVLQRRAPSCRMLNKGCSLTWSRTSGKTSWRKRCFSKDLRVILAFSP